MTYWAFHSLLEYAFGRYPALAVAVAVAAVVQEHVTSYDTLRLQRLQLDTAAKQGFRDSGVMADKESSLSFDLSVHRAG